MAGLGELERCVRPVSIRMGANRCVLDGYGVSEVRGTAKHRCRALTGAITRVTQKREILVHAGLQHVRSKEWRRVSAFLSFDQQTFKRFARPPTGR